VIPKLQQKHIASGNQLGSSSDEFYAQQTAAKKGLILKLKNPTIATPFFALLLVQASSQKLSTQVPHATQKTKKRSLQERVGSGPPTKKAKKPPAKITPKERRSEEK
jgi:hypothetical protein